MPAMMTDNPIPDTETTSDITTTSDLAASDLAAADLVAIWQETLNWQPTVEQQVLFQRLYETIVTANQQFNLTRITEPTEFWEKHLWDSLRGIKRFLGADDRQSLIDVGTGAGFPGLPIAIACPGWNLTLLDSTRKKINFVNQTAQQLGLKGVTGLSDRVELLGQARQYREQYDIATIRAVAAVSVCAEYVLPLVKVGGVAILYRGQWSLEEETALTAAVKELGATIEQVDSFTTPFTHGARACVYLRKTAPTANAYPRAVGIPTQKPL